MTSEGEPSQYCCHLQRSLVLSRTMPQRVGLGSRWGDWEGKLMNIFPIADRISCAHRSAFPSEDS